MATIIVHCYYSGPTGTVQKFFDDMRGGLLEEVLAEEGCIQYDYYLSAADGSSGVLLEKWRSRAALNAHLNGAAMARVLPTKEMYGLATRVEIYEVKE